MQDHSATTHHVAETLLNPSNKSQARLSRYGPWIAAAFAVVTFANSLGNDYAYDDVPIVKEGSRIHEAGKWVEIWTTDYWHDLKNTAPNRDLLYRPLTLTSIRLVRV